MLSRTRNIIMHMILFRSGFVLSHMLFGDVFLGKTIFSGKYGKMASKLPSSGMTEEQKKLAQLLMIKAAQEGVK